MSKFDVAVVGAGLGGLAAAALLSRQKKRTLVVERGASLSDALGVWKKDGFVFCADPTMTYGFERGGELHELATGLGILQNVSVYSPCYQVALQGRRITVFAEQSETLEELKREFPREINVLIRFYRDLHKESVRNAKSRVSSFYAKHRSAAGFIRHYRFSRELTAFFDVQALYFFQKTAGELSVASLILLCDTPPLKLHGGFKTLAEQLYRDILQQGGEVRFNEPSAGIDTRNNRVSGIRTAEGSIEAKTVLLVIAPSRRPSTLFIGLREEVVPVGMCQEVLYLPDYARPRDFITLSLSAKDDTESAPLGMRTLTASIHTQQGLLAAKQEIIEHVGRIIPFLNEHLVFAEEYRGVDGEALLPTDILFKPYRSGDSVPLLFRGSIKNSYLLHDAQQAPLQVLSAVKRFVNIA